MATLMNDNTGFLPRWQNNGQQEDAGCSWKLQLLSTGLFSVSILVSLASFVGICDPGDQAKEKRTSVIYLHDLHSITLIMSYSSPRDPE